mmetsp:Transcript_11565/g.21613  ORF Transcript_11565/g.21613 Transcript_11565/m.21613 type:complete len:256 (+) Transcript_11565:125-892(+)
MKILNAIVSSALLAAHASAFATTVSVSKTITANSATVRAYSLQSRKMVTESSSPFDFLSGIFPKKEKVPNEPQKPRLPDVVIDSDYTLSYVFAAIGIFIILTSPDETCVPGSSFVCPPSIWGVVQGGLNLLFASFLAIQARRIRFVFDETSFELKNVDFGASNEEVLRASGENIVVGGANRWDYDKFVNYDFFPSADYPVLVYFKETQTPEEKWNEGPGGLDKVGGGQVHFFPAIANVKQLKEQFEIRGCAKIEN